MTQEKIEQEFRQWLLNFSTTYITDPYMARQAYLAGRKSTVPKIKEALDLMQDYQSDSGHEGHVLDAMNILEELTND